MNFGRIQTFSHNQSSIKPTQTTHWPLILSCTTLYLYHCYLSVYGLLPLLNGEYRSQNDLKICVDHSSYKFVSLTSVTLTFIIFQSPILRTTSCVLPSPHPKLLHYTRIIILGSESQTIVFYHLFLDLLLLSHCVLNYLSTQHKFLLVLTPCLSSMSFRVQHPTQRRQSP